MHDLIMRVLFRPMLTVVLLVLSAGAEAGVKEAQDA